MEGGGSNKKSLPRRFLLSVLRPRAALPSCLAHSNNRDQPRSYVDRPGGGSFSTKNRAPRVWNSTVPATTDTMSLDTRSARSFLSKPRRTRNANSPIEGGEAAHSAFRAGTATRYRSVWTTSSPSST